MWHLMLPSKAGKPVSQISREGCMWGMGNYMYQFPDKREYALNKARGPAEVELATVPERLVAGTPATLTVTLKDINGSPATLFVDMEKLLHAVIISKDQSVFAHIHPDDLRPLTQQEIDTSTFTLAYTFPKAGEYILSLDYAHGITLESKQFILNVLGNASQSGTVQYTTPATFSGYTVALEYAPPIAGELSTFKYLITKDGKPVTLMPYLSAAMHIAAVKNDFSWYLHAHGEVHPPGTPYPPVVIKNGKVVHSMAMMVTPNTFALPVDAHVVFPSAGLYTIWGQFKTASGELVATAFTVRVE
jgi:Cu+-exporting ATPase